MNTSLQQGAALLLCLAMASCTGTTNTSTTSKDSTSATGMAPGDSSVTTTTTVTHHKYAGTFQPQANTKYIDLKTHKQVTVRIDTVRGTVVNTETNEPMDLFVAPGSHDTIYGQTGTVVNNYIVRDQSGDYSVDQARMSGSSNTDMNNNTPATATTADTTASTATTGREKYKQKANGDTKIKTEDEKIKMKGDKVKIKDR